MTKRLAVWLGAWPSRTIPHNSAIDFSLFTVLVNCEKVRGFPVLSLSNQHFDKPLPGRRKNGAATFPETR